MMPKVTRDLELFGWLISEALRLSVESEPRPIRGLGSMMKESLRLIRICLLRLTSSWCACFPS